MTPKAMLTRPLATSLRTSGTCSAGRSRRNVTTGGVCLGKMTLAKERAKKIAKTRRLPKTLQQRERMLDSIDLVGRLHDAAASRKALIHNHNLGIEKDRLATHARGAALQGLAVVGEQLRRNEQQMAADFAAAVRGTPRYVVRQPTSAGSMTSAPQTPNLPPLGAPLSPPLGPRAVPGTPVARLLRRRIASR